MDKKTKIVIVSFLFILLIGALCFLYFVVSLENKSYLENNIQENTKKEMPQINDNANQSQEIKNDTLNNTTTEDTIEEEQKTQEPIIKDDKYYYFAYGSNMDLDKIRARTKTSDINPISSAYLENYKLTMPRGVGNIEKSNGEILWGCLFLLSKNNVYDLDVIEGYKEGRTNNSYDRKVLQVKTQDGKIYDAYVYIQPISGGNTTSISYKETLIKGSIDCNLPIYYTNKLKNIETY